jgi:DNA methylase
LSGTSPFLTVAGDLARLPVDEQRVIASRLDLTTEPRRNVQELVRVCKAELARRRAEATQERRRLAVEAQPAAPPIRATFRLYRGDNRGILPTLAAESVQLVFTSPSFGVRWHYGDDGSSDDVSPDEKMAELVEFLPKIARVLRPGGILALNLPASIKPRDHPLRTFPLTSKVEDWLWDEGLRHGLLHRDTINWQHIGADGRPLATNTAFGAPSNWHARRTRENVILVSKDTYSIAGKHEWPALFDYLEVCKDTWLIGPGHARPGGPLAFPDELVRHLVDLFSEPGDVVLDPYAGTGTTARVSLAMGREAWLIEREESYLPALEALAQGTS